MKIKLDENMPRAMAQLLREVGHDVSTATDEALGGADDVDLGSAASAEDRILITFDVGFGNIVISRPLLVGHGICLRKCRALPAPRPRFARSFPSFGCSR